MSKQAKTAITPIRADDFPQWYQEVIKAADMAENAPVRGCMIIKPYGYAVWENMQRIFDGMIKELGVENAYFPLLIPLEFISREAEHVEGFAKECAVVTHHRLEMGADGKLQPAESAKLEEPYVIRPTSETIIGDSMARWVQSYRDLPLKLNQWCNVMRWEMRTRLFLRTSEFLWQEGHNAFETAEESRADAFKMLEAYATFIENSLAIPVIQGEKTPEERFPGAIMTYTVEAMMQDGKALQAGTSHDLGQNFAHGCGIKFQGRDGSEQFAHTTSWGISTRLIGAMIMTHGDDDGMIMPPRVAPHQVAIIPVVHENPGTVFDVCGKLEKTLKDKGIRVFLDKSEARTSDKMWGVIKKGVPIRVEIGAREADGGNVTYIRRDLGKDSKKTVSVDEFVGSVQGVLEEMQAALFKRAKDFRDARIHDVKDLAGVAEFFKKDGVGFARIDVKMLAEAEFEAMKKEYSLTVRCLPLNDKGQKALVARAY